MDDLLQHIIRKTSRYAGISPPVSFHMRKWSKEDLMEYFGLWVMMGFHKLPCYRDFWSHHPTVRVELFPQTMPCDGFDQLTTHLHFAHLEEKEEVPEDHLWKLQTVIDTLNTTFVETLVPKKDIAIDESLWKFHRRLRFVTFNKNKGARFGLKVYKLSSSTGLSSRYTLWFRIYTDQDKSTVLASMKAVLDLLELSGSIWNWYTSPSLIHLL
ncbi:piggyBac transposable element-derived protein 4-like [Penaeus japonicus]|uniref:piggyBac transposable element-derived protein 4-like n=1 Tax=Penaeus japonicus TaxID=27405 RepID=UPI001C7102AF|nr:piggyBac transposable element-derived protein 4-like [Penaeus japonicus]